MTQNLHFRRYSPGDFDSCQSIFDSNCPKFFAANEREAFLKFLREMRYPYFVVTDDEFQVLAGGGFVIEKGAGELAWGMVRSDCHMQGIGTFLFTKRLEEIRKGGADAVIVDTSQHSLGFYQSFGFQVLSRKPDGYGPGLDRFDLKLELDKRRKESTDSNTE